MSVIHAVFSNKECILYRKIISSWRLKLPERNEKKNIHCNARRRIVTSLNYQDLGSGEIFLQKYIRNTIT